MTTTKQQITEIIARLQENISRLEATIRISCWQTGYVTNCKASIASYKEQIAKWELELAASN